MGPSKEFRDYQKKLKRLADDALPRAVAETMNSVATVAHIQSIRNMRERFTLRNQYTERGIRYYKASPKKDWRKINAITGSISPYMDIQDQGGVRRPKRGRRAPIAALAARGGNRSAVVRKKYRAGQLGPNQFVGRPRGAKARPTGVWERYAKNKRIRLIRNLENASIRVTGRRWHSDAVERYATREWIEGAFIREAKRRISAQ